MTLFPALRVCPAASLLIGAALQRARQLKCTGAFSMGKEWMPCKDFATYEKAISRES